MDVFEAVRDRREELGVPGVAVGLLDGGAERHEAFGVTSVEQPLAVTPDTRFQIGSISLWSYTTTPASPSRDAWWRSSRVSASRTS